MLSHRSSRGQGGSEIPARRTSSGSAGDGQGVYQRLRRHQRPRRPRRRAAFVALGALVALAAVMLGLSAGLAGAQPDCTDSWNNTAGGSWSTATDWTNDVGAHVVPTGSDDVCIIPTGNY